MGLLPACVVYVPVVGHDVTFCPHVLLHVPSDIKSEKRFESTVHSICIPLIAIMLMSCPPPFPCCPGVGLKFNDSDEISASELARGINVSDAEIVRHLFPLVCSRPRFWLNFFFFFLADCIVW